MSDVCLMLSTATAVGGEIGGPVADNELPSLIVTVRGANENKCEPLHGANMVNGSETTSTRAGLRRGCWVLIRCLTCSYATLQLLILSFLWMAEMEERPAELDYADYLSV